MKMNRYYSIFAFVLVVLSYVSCSSDDKTDTPTPPTEKEVLTDADSLIIRQQMAVVNILSKLTGRDDIGPDFDTKQYAPDYGSVRDEALPYVRAIAVADATEAENQFRALVGSHFVQTTADGLAVTLADMTLRTDGRRQTLGTLTFHRAINDERLAYADVAIDCMPALRRIEYIDEKNWGLNAASPYMMGQLVYYGGSTYTTGLYVCVRTSTDGTKASAMKIPQTSSMTIQPGSSVPVSFIAFFTNGMAAKKTMRAAGCHITMPRLLIWNSTCSCCCAISVATVMLFLPI